MCLACHIALAWLFRVINLLVLYRHHACPDILGETGTVAVSYMGVGSGGGEHSPSMQTMQQNEASTAPVAAPQIAQGGDPGLTVLQPPASQSQVASAIPPYSTMLPSFGHYTTGEYRMFSSLVA